MGLSAATSFQPAMEGAKGGNFPPWLPVSILVRPESPEGPMRSVFAPKIRPSRCRCRIALFKGQRFRSFGCGLSECFPSAQRIDAGQPHSTERCIG